MKGYKETIKKEYKYGRVFMNRSRLSIQFIQWSMCYWCVYGDTVHRYCSDVRRQSSGVCQLWGKAAPVPDGLSPEAPVAPPRGQEGEESVCWVTGVFDDFDD